MSDPFYSLSQTKNKKEKWVSSGYDTANDPTQLKVYISELKKYIAELEEELFVEKVVRNIQANL